MYLEKSPPIAINKGLLPFSCLYGVAVKLRNSLFRMGILKQKKYNVPIICIGNIAVGGTGKTPHTEYIIKLLKDKYRVAVVSRGYKRKSKGFRLADLDSTVFDIGDEPFQMKQKFPEILLAVDAKRSRAIDRLLNLENPPEVIIMDDGFQHRYVKPSYTIILTDFNRPLYKDCLLPAGRLREPANLIENVNNIVVSKCPDHMKPLEYRLIEHNVNPYPFQGLYFTKFVYGNLLSVFDNSKSLKLCALSDTSILLVTGIASPDILVKKLKEYTQHLEVLSYPDHYQFKKNDINTIKSAFEKIGNDRKIILFTEKDTTRIKNMNSLDSSIVDYSYFIPIEVEFLKEDYKKQFDKKILAHVKNYSINC